MRASLLQLLFLNRSERQLVEHSEYNLLYRWFVGLDIDDPVWDHSIFTQNRDRLLDNEMPGHFFAGVKQLAEWAQLSGDEHFSIDGTLFWMPGLHTKASCARMAAAIRRTTTAVTPSRDFFGEKRSNATHEVDARIKAVQTLGVIPHVAAKRRGSAVPDDIRQSEGYAIRLKIRKRIEEVFGWMKTVGGIRKLN